MNIAQLPKFKRDVTSKIAGRIREERRFIQVVTGPRQVGKTTAVLQVIQDVGCESHYAAADFPAPPHEGWISQQWEIIRRKLPGAQKAILVLDEVQKISRWSDEVKRLWDEDSRLGKNIQVIILGSSALLLQKGLQESLTGRFEAIHCSHWSWNECKDCFGWPLEKYLFFGGYPGAASLIGDEQRWASYVRDSLIETVLSKDILLLNRVEKPALLRQLFVLACEYGGQIMSYQKLLGQLTDAGNTVTLAHYQSLLESAFIIRGLHKWSGGRVAMRRSSPKWLPLNTALMTALSVKSYADWRNAPDAWGRLVETAVGAHLVNSTLGKQYEVLYWRQGNYEIDFLVQKGKQLVCIEVKSGSRKMHLDGLNLFAKTHKNARTIVVGSAGVSIEEFLSTPVEHWFE